MVFNSKHDLHMPRTPPTTTTTTLEKAPLEATYLVPDMECAQPRDNVQVDRPHPLRLLVIPQGPGLFIQPVVTHMQGSQPHTTWPTAVSDLGDCTTQGSGSPSLQRQ
jgi:hypothetical protein